jgi:2-dehydropantoate 2-reductase
MRILVIGAGATGGYFGARLLAAGRDVTFLVRPRRLAQLAEHGLIVRSPHGPLTLVGPPCVQANELRQPYDLILLSCKAYDLPSAIDAFAPAVGPDTLILPLLNGMAHLDVLDARFSREHVLGGKCVISVTMGEDGVIEHFSPSHSVTFGERDGVMSQSVRRVHAQLDGAGFDAQASVRIVQDMWEKWVFLAAAAGATSLMRAPIGAIVAAPHGQALALQLLDECAAIAAANGHAPRAAEFEPMRSTLTAAGSPLKASMLRDIERHGRVESDQIVGDLLARRPAATAGAPLTALQLVLCHLKAYEATRT